MVNDPFDDVRRLHEYIDRMFSDIFARKRDADPVFARAPLIDLADEGDKFRIVADIPGIEKEDLDVRVLDDSIIIRAESGSSNEERGRNYYVRERGRVSYYRAVSLPEPVIPEKAEASYKNGILEIVVPKRAPERSKDGFRVEVK